MDRVNSWAEIMNRLGDPSAGAGGRAALPGRDEGAGDCRQEIDGVVRASRTGVMHSQV